MSSSDLCEYSKVDTSTFPYFSSLSCVVHCFLLTPRVGFHLRRYIQTLGTIRSVIINLLISFLKNSHHTYLSRHFHSLSEIYFHATSTSSWLDLHVIEVPATLAAAYIAYIMIV